MIYDYDHFIIINVDDIIIIIKSYFYYLTYQRPVCIYGKLLYVAGSSYDRSAGA